MAVWQSGNNVTVAPLHAPSAAFSLFRSRARARRLEIPPPPSPPPSSCITTHKNTFSQFLSLANSVLFILKAHTHPTNSLLPSLTYQARALSLTFPPSTPVPTSFNLSLCFRWGKNFAVLFSVSVPSFQLSRGSRFGRSCQCRRKLNRYFFSTSKLRKKVPIDPFQNFEEKKFWSWKKMKTNQTEIFLRNCLELDKPVCCGDDYCFKSIVMNGQWMRMNEEWKDGKWFKVKLFSILWLYSSK